MNRGLWVVLSLMVATNCRRSSAPDGDQGAANDRSVHTRSSAGPAASAAQGVDEEARAQAAVRHSAAENSGQGPSGPRNPGPVSAEHRALATALTHAFGDFELKLTHRTAPHEARGSGHTHCAPDHSAVDPADQERRLASLGVDHRHHFVWMTAHNFVAPDPQIPGVQHMFGVEIYTKRVAGQSSPHMVALLPDDALVGEEERPFGVYQFDIPGTAKAIAAAGGLAVLAHPSRYSPSQEALLATGAELWGIEVLSGSTRPEENVRFIDERLSAGKFTCLSAGGDIHGEEYKLTSGYQVVAATGPEPGPRELFSAIAACNFFSCGVKSPEHGPIRGPRMDVRDGKLRFTSQTVLRSVRFVGKGGKVLQETKRTTQASYQPRREDGYVRVEAVSADGNARCYSQPAWITPHAEGRQGEDQRAHPASESRGSNTNRTAP